jgi:hypothetical protein
MAALRKEQTRFSTGVQLKHLLRNAKPEGCVHFDRILVLPESFRSLVLKNEERQSIPKLQKKRKRIDHSVDLDTTDAVVLACDGTPIIDAHLNLRLKPAPDSSSTAGANQIEEPPPVPVVLFIQYKHSKPEADAVLKVSEMDAAVGLLESRLEQCNWDGREWLFLWISNRKIDADVGADARLIWVGKSELGMHAPLIGRRGPVPVESCRDAEVEDDGEE